MADSWKILEELTSPLPRPTPLKPSARKRKRSYGLAAASVLLVALVVWATQSLLQLFPALSNWQILLNTCIAAAVASAILWKVPQWQVGNGDDLASGERFHRVNEARKTLALIVGGMALLGGFYAAMQNVKVAQKSLAVARENQMTARFTQAIEQMGAVNAGGEKNLEVRMAGIYALERIAGESERDHWPAIEVLAAYVRGNAPREDASHAARPANAFDDKPATDVQTVLTVLGRRDLQWEYLRPVLDLHDTELRRAKLFQAQLVRADLSETDLSGANLIEAALIRANLSGTDLSGADLTGAELTGADLRGARLKGANLGGAYLIDARFASADLSWARLALADLRRADLGSADLAKSDLTGADLSGANLAKVKNLTQRQVDAAKGDVNTTLPVGRRMPDAWKANGGK